MTKLLALCAVVLLSACGSSTSESDPPLQRALRSKELLGYEVVQESAE